MENLARSIRELPWIGLLLLVIFVDGLVGGVVRIAGRQTTSKVVGWILIISFFASIIHLPFLIRLIAGVVYAVCWIADIITVAVSKDFVFFAD